jgi:hypothetical protein
MKVAILLLRGNEGCGVCRYALEEQKWYLNNGIQCDVYASLDKKWGRRKSQQNNFIEFENSEIVKLKNKLNSEYDIVYYQSLPSKSHSETYQKLSYEHLVCGVTKPLKLSHQNDHKLQSLSRNSMIWETMAEMDGAFTHSLLSPFAKKMKEMNPQVPLIKMGLGFDFDELKPYWKPITSQVKRISYFGRFAGFKDPLRIINMQPLLEKHGIIGEMKGIERSIGSLDLFYTDLKDRKNSYRKNIVEVKKEAVLQTPDKVWIYGPYNRLEGIEDLSRSMFGADFYNLDSEAYGDNMEFAMCEIIATGVVPVFDKHWADNCMHLSGVPFKDIKDFAIYSDRSDLEGMVEQMSELSIDNTAREKRRLKCLEWAKSHCDNNIVYKKMHENAINVSKRTVKENNVVKTNALF